MAMGVPSQGFKKKMHLRTMFFFLAIYCHISYVKKTLATNRKGVFHLKSLKSDNNFFWGRKGVATFMSISYNFKFL
jgi:hypothetical protein